jgi:hypothetical protein
MKLKIFLELFLIGFFDSKYSPLYLKSSLINKSFRTLQRLIISIIIYYLF